MPSVFISAKSEDYEFARQVYAFLRQHGVPCFYSEESIAAMGQSAYKAAIDAALDDANHLLVVTSSRSHVESKWVRYEWDTFANEQLSGRKSGNLLTVLCGAMDARSLPLALRQHQALPFNDLEKVLRFLPGCVNTSPPGSRSGAAIAIEPPHSGPALEISGTAHSAAPADSSARYARRKRVMMGFCTMIVVLVAFSYWQRQRPKHNSGASQAPRDSVATNSTGTTARESNHIESIPVQTAASDKPTNRLDVEAVRGELREMSNKLAAALLASNNNAAATDAAARIAGEEMAKRNARIAELESDIIKFSRQDEELTKSIEMLEARIKEAQSRKDIANVARLTQERDELNRQQQDLRTLRAQCTKLKDEMAIARRLEWIRLGLTGITNPARGLTSTPGLLPQPAPANELVSNSTVKTQPPIRASTSVIAAAETFSAPPVPRKLPAGRFTNSIGMVLIEILPGKFMMGSPEYEFGRRDGSWSDSDELAHEVTVWQRYHISTTEVTQGQFELIMEMNPSPRKGTNLPVHQVTWNRAAEFCALLSAREKINYRLPSEVEWEYACRAGTTTPYSSGKTEEGLKRIANYYAQRSGPGEGVKPVASLEPNQWGLYDMHGNVSEWTRDETRSVTSAYYLRGGSSGHGASGVRSSARETSLKNNSNVTFGFRVVASER